MVKLYKNFNIKNIHKNSIILIGNFDGVHLGHKALINEVISDASKLGYHIFWRIFSNSADFLKIHFTNIVIIF